MSEEDKSVYTDTSNHLQNILLIFLGFLLFVSFFIFFPYYPLIDSYNTLVNIGILSNQTKDTLEAVKLVVLEYPEYKINNQKIIDDSSIYKEKLAKGIEKFNNSDFTSIKNQTELNDTRTYSLCLAPNVTNWNEWRICNENEYLRNIKNEASVTIDVRTTTRIKDMILFINQSVSEIKSNNIHYKIIKDPDINNLVRNISKWQESVNEVSRDNKINLKYPLLEKLFFKDTELVIPNTIKENRKILEDKIKTFNENIKELSFPIVGQVPFNLTQVLLSFPIIIIIGFSYISLQIKKLIIIHKKLNLDKKKDKVFLSWIDPIQEVPERIYPILVIILPAFLFGLFLIIINSIWYSNIQYVENYSLLTDDLTFGPFNIRDMVMFLNYCSIAVFGYCYYQIGKAWSQQQDKGNNNDKFDFLDY